MKQLHEKGERVLPESTVAWSTAQVPIHRSPPIPTDLHKHLPLSWANIARTAQWFIPSWPVLAVIPVAVL